MKFLMVKQVMNMMIPKVVTSQTESTVEKEGKNTIVVEDQLIRFKTTKRIKNHKNLNLLVKRIVVDLIFD